MNILLKYIYPSILFISVVFISGCGGGGGGGGSGGSNTPTTTISLSASSSNLYADIGENASATFTITSKTDNLVIDSAKLTTQTVNISGISRPYELFDNNCTTGLNDNGTCSFKVRYSPTSTSQYFSTADINIQVGQKHLNTSLMGAEKTFIYTSAATPANSITFNSHVNPLNVRLFDSDELNYTARIQNNTTQSLSNVKLLFEDALKGVKITTTNNCVDNKACNIASINFSPKSLASQGESNSQGTKLSLNFKLKQHDLSYNLGYLKFTSYGKQYFINPLYDLGENIPQPLGSFITFIKQLSANSIIIGTTDGLYFSYDNGLSWHTLDQYHTSISAYNNTDSTSFVSTGDTLLVYDYDTQTGLTSAIKAYQYNQNSKLIPKGEIIGIFLNQNKDKLIIVARGGIAIDSYDKSTSTITKSLHYYQVTDLSINYIVKAIFDNSKWLMLATAKKGVQTYQYDNTNNNITLTHSYTTTSINEKLPSDNITNISLYHAASPTNDALFISTIKGLVAASYLNGALSNINLTDVTYPFTNSIDIIDNKWMIIGSQLNGLSVGKYDPSTRKISDVITYKTTTQPSLANNYVTALSRKDKTLLVGIAKSGLLKIPFNSTSASSKDFLDMTKVSQYTQTPLLPPYTISSLQSEGNNITITTTGGGVCTASTDPQTYQLSINNCYNTTSKIKLPSNGVTNALFNKNQLLLGFDNGLSIAEYKDNAITNIHTFLNTHYISSIAQKDTTLFIGTTDIGLILAKLDGSNLSSLKTYNNPVLPSDHITTVKTANNLVFIGTLNGLSIGKYNPDSQNLSNFTTYNASNILPDSQINALAVKNGYLYIGTSKGLVIAKYDNNKGSLSDIHTYTTSSSIRLTNANIATLSLYSNNKLIIGTDSNLLMVATLNADNSIKSITSLTLPSESYTSIKSATLLGNKLLLGITGGNLLLGEIG